jgi:hypothetical protein
MVPVLLLLASCTRYGYQSPLATDDGSVRDKHPAPEQGWPDSFVVPDAGCPPGFTQCGQICADLLNDARHCGGCDAPCPSGVHDACVNGECRCGEGPICTGGLNCVDGSCRCIKGGLCPGCCDGNKCIPPGPCDDGNLCTTGDTCAAGTCKGAPVSCSHLDEVCVDGTCDPQTGQCKAVNKPNGTFCPDDLYCTVGTTCQDGVCSGGKPRSCEDDCNTGTCNEQTDECDLTNKPDGTACNDNKECTTDDACQAGKCTGVPKGDGTSCGSIGSKCCGTACCSMTEPVCCSSINKCCSFGSTCCGNGCCNATEKCCSETTCCSMSETCCGTKCCSIGQTCCGNVTCCNIGTKCCPDYTCKFSCP